MCITTLDHLWQPALAAAAVNCQLNANHTCKCCHVWQTPRFTPPCCVCVQSAPQAMLRCCYVGWDLRCCENVAQTREGGVKKAHLSTIPSGLEAIRSKCFLFRQECKESETRRAITSCTRPAHKLHKWLVLQCSSLSTSDSGRTRASLPLMCP